MFARTIAILGAAIAIAGITATQAHAFGCHHARGCKPKPCCQPTVCYKQVMSPPVYRTIMVRVMVHPGSCTNHHTPPVYSTQAQQVVVQPERQVAHYTPAVYGRVNETYLARPGYTRWRHKFGRCGERVKCAVEVPAVYKTRCRKVEIQPASRWVETKPAVMGVVHRRVMVHPGRVKRVCQPPVYRMVPKQIMVSPGAAQWVPVAGCGRRW